MSDLDIQLREHYADLVAAGFWILRCGGDFARPDDWISEDEFVQIYDQAHFHKPAGAGKVDLVRVRDGLVRAYRGVNIQP